MSSRKGRKAAGFRTKSGAVKVQVLLHPKEYREIVIRSGMTGTSVSAHARFLIGYALAWPAGMPELHGKYQPRGFAKC